MIYLKTREEIEAMAMGGHKLKQVLDELSELVIPGTSTLDIEKKANELIKEIKGKPSFKGMNGFPFSICASINEEIVHGIPRADKILREGDIFSLDFGIFFKLENFVKEIDPEKYPNIKNGFHTDMARTFGVGEVDSEAKRLMMVTKKMLKLGIKKVRPGITFGDLGETMQRYADKQGYGIIRELCGHGIGKNLHEDPSVLNYGQRHRGPKMETGMVFCIEPMLSLGSHDIKWGKDGFSFITKDKSLSAHFEDMVAVTEDGVRILTI